MSKAVNAELVSKIKENVLIPDYVSEVIIPAMPWYFEDYHVDFYSRPYIKCPLHGEDTPSFRWYEETNTFFCFGCGLGGDIIKLHQLFVDKLNNESISFGDAVEFLNKKFIDKVDVGNISKTTTNKKATKILSKGALDRVEQSDVEMLRFKKYYSDLDRTLQRSESISLEDKKKIYRYIDDALRLVKDNIVHAEDALEYIKENLALVLSKN